MTISDIAASQPEPENEPTVPLEEPALVTETPVEDSSSNASPATTEPGDTPLESTGVVGGSDAITPTSTETTATVVEEPVDAFLEAILNKIQPVKGNHRKNFKLFLYSDPGAGKTVLAGQAPNNLIIDVEDGLISLNNHPDLIQDTVASIKYKSFGGLEVIIDRLNKKVPQLDHFETVTVDSISELHKRGLAEVTEREWSNAPAVKNRYAAETEDHTENNEHIRRLVSSMRDLDRNLILLSHARTIEPKGMPPKTFPDFSEKLANTLAGIVDVVGYMYKREVEGKVERVIRFHSNGQIVAKTRVGGFPDEMVDPTWEKIYAIFEKATPLEA